MTPRRVFSFCVAVDFFVWGNYTTRRQNFAAQQLLKKFINKNQKNSEKILKK